MGILNLLEKTIPVFGQTYDVSLNWIAQLIRWLITSVGIVGVGIILFSLCLKLVVLPFDIYQRISMRKQNQKMKKDNIPLLFLIVFINFCPFCVHKNSRFAATDTKLKFSKSGNITRFEVISRKFESPNLHHKNR